MNTLVRRQMSTKHVLFILLLLSATAIFYSCKKKSSTSALPPDDDTTPVQLVNYKFKAIHENITSNSGGYYEALPPSYDIANENFPLLIFIHGGAEIGNGSEQELPLVLVHSVPKRIANKTLPVKFTYGGKDFSFIIIMPQFRVRASANNVKDVINYMLEHYRVDSSRIYMSGLSQGGGVTWEFAGSSHGEMLAAIVPICGASWADTTLANRIAANKVPVWAFHNNDDDLVPVASTWRYANFINAANPPVPVRVTIWPTGGHDAWTRASDPNYREEGKNMYEWMLQYTRE